MADRIDNQDNLDEFGFRTSKQLDRRVPKRDADKAKQDGRTDTGGETGGVPSAPFTLQSLLSGDTYTATTSSIPAVSASTELALNYDRVQDLAFFGSVYTRVAIAIDRIKDEYPNGFLIGLITSGSS